MESRTERRRVLLVVALLALGLGSQEWLAQMRRSPAAGTKRKGDEEGEQPATEGRPAPEAEDVSGGESVDGLPGVVVRQRHAAAQALVTTVLRAAEAVNAAETGSPAVAALPTPPTFATPLDCDLSTIPGDFTALLDILGRIQTLMAGDTHLSAQISRVREAFGDGELLEALLRQLFPGQKTRPFLAADGKPLLTKAEVRVLREAARDQSREEIAAALGITADGVRTHLNNIYKKLGVNRPLRAVGRAISMGYLEMDALDVVRSITQGDATRNYGLFDSLMGTAARLDGPPRGGDGGGGMRPIAEFGLFLVALSGVAEKLHDDALSFPSDVPPAAVHIVRLPQGRVLRSFGHDFLRGRCSLALVPPHAARQGFTPGNLLVGHYAARPENVNAALITEFTPDGQVVRSFGGGPEVGSRLFAVLGMAFHPDGRLLVPSGSLTDCLLAFSDGGRKVERWVNGVCSQAAVGPDGRVYTAGTGGATTLIRVYAPSGEQVAHFGGPLPEGSAYTGIAVTSQGRIWVNRWHGPERERRLVEFDANGDQQRAIPLPGLEDGPLHADAQGRRLLYVPCARSKEIKVLDATTGAVAGRIPTEGLAPNAVATTAAANDSDGDGRIFYVTGLLAGSG